MQKLFTSAAVEVGNFLSAVVQGMRSKSVAIAKIHGTLYFLKALKVLRLFCMTIVGLFSAIALAAVGLMTVHAVLLFIVPFSLTTRIWLGLGLGVLELGIAVYIYIKAFSDKTWIQLSPLNELLENADVEAKEHSLQGEFK